MDVQHGRGLSPWGRTRTQRPGGGGGGGGRRALLWFVRYGIPLATFLAGIVIIGVDKDRSTALEAGFMFFGVALAVLLLNLFFRIGVRGEGERDREEDARRYFDRYGRWPDDRPDG